MLLARAFCPKSGTSAWIRTHGGIPLQRLAHFSDIMLLSPREPFNFQGSYFIDICCMQHFARQDIERRAIGPLELDRTEDDPEEYDADHCLPSFREKTRGRGNFSSAINYDDDDCCVVTILDPVPLSISHQVLRPAEPAAGDAVPLATVMPAAPASGSMPVLRPSSSSAPTSLPPPARPRMRTKRPAERSTRGGRGRSKAPRPTIQGYTR